MNAASPPRRDDTAPETPPHLSPAETERADPRYADLETRPLGSLLGALMEGQDTALGAVRAALPAIERAVAAAAPLLADERGRISYAGAGTSGRLAMLDGAELPPTFGWPAERCVFLVAGGTAALRAAREGAEDSEEAAQAAVRAARIGTGDVLLALAASGRTPFTLAAARSARESGALTIGFANDPAAPLLDACEHAVLLRTGAEVLAGSTRMAAGTSQKIALTLFSTAVMVRNGKVFRGRMVDMRPSNAKLRQRAGRIVAEVADCSAAEADEALRARSYDIRAAILDLEARDRSGN